MDASKEKTVKQRPQSLTGWLPWPPHGGRRSQLLRHPRPKPKATVNF